MADKQKRLKFYRERGPEIIRLAEQMYAIIRSRYASNYEVIERMPRKRAMFAFCLYFLELQINHMKALLLLERRKNLDVLLVIRSVIEGTSQIIYVRKSQNPTPKNLALQWWDFLFHQQKGYWHRKKATELVKLLEKHFDEFIWKPQKSDLFAFYQHFSAYHHWNRTERMGWHKEDSLSLGFGLICLRYTIESINELLDLRLDCGDPLPI
jgi:hypothetical protein